MLHTSVFSPTRHVVKAGLGSIFQRRETKGPGCLIGCGLNYPRFGLDWPESQLTSARCNFQGTRCYKYLSTWKICSYIFKLTICRFLFMRIENSKIIPIGYIEVLHSEVMVMEQREKFSKMLSCFMMISNTGIQYIYVHTF